MESLISGTSPSVNDIIRKIFNNRGHVYYRVSTYITDALEDALSEMMGAHAVVTSSGLSAFWVSLLHLRPKLVRTVGSLFPDTVESIRVYRKVVRPSVGSVVVSQDPDEDLRRCGVRGTVVDVTLHPFSDPFGRGAVLAWSSLAKYLTQEQYGGGVVWTRDPDLAHEMRSHTRYQWGMTLCCTDVGIVHAVRASKRHFESVTDIASRVVAGLRKEGLDVVWPGVGGLVLVRTRNPDMVAESMRGIHLSIGYGGHSCKCFWRVDSDHVRLYVGTDHTPAEVVRSVVRAVEAVGSRRRRK